MIEFTGSWTGLEGLGEEALAELRPKAERAVMKALLLYQRELKKTLTGKRSGRKYKVSKKGKLHIASAPGEPPAVLFGNLLKSVGVTPPKWDGNTIEGEVGIGLGVKPAGGVHDPAKTYARRLEFGGSDSRGIYIAPRPYLEPTSIRVEPQIEAILEGGL